MSIIHNALKKTQNQFEKKNGDRLESRPTWKSPKAPPVSLRPPERPPSAISHGHPLPVSMRSVEAKKEAGLPKNAAIFIGIFLLGGFVSLAAFVYFLKSPPDSLSLDSLSNSSDTEAPAGRSKRIILNGTMMKGDKMIALINNEIYEEGDYLNDMRIEKITLDKVELLNAGKRATLHLRPKKK